MAETDENNKEDEKQEESTETELKVEPVDMIQKANDAAERLEGANKELAQLINKQEAMQVEKTLGGQTEAGIAVKTLSKDEKSIANAKEFLRGSGMEDEAFPSETPV